MLRVQAKQCATCIFKKTSPLDLEQLLAQIADPKMEGYFKGHRICHHSKDACCRGFWDHHKDDFTLGQLAHRLNMVEFVNDDVLKKTRSVRGKKHGQKN